MQSPRSIALQCCGGLSRAAIGLSREGCWAKGQQAWLGSAAVSTRTPHHHPDSWCWWSYWSLWSCYWVSTQRRSLLNFVPKYCHLLRQWPWHRTDSKMSDKKCLGPRLWSVNPIWPGVFGSIGTRGGADLPPPNKNGVNGWEVQKISWNLISYQDWCQT